MRWHVQFVFVVIAVVAKGVARLALPVKLMAPHVPQHSGTFIYGWRVAGVVVVAVAVLVLGWVVAERWLSVMGSE